MSRATYTEPLVPWLPSAKVDIESNTGIVSPRLVRNARSWLRVRADAPGCRAEVLLEA